MKGIVVAIYIVLMIIFLVTSALIFRHTVKFSYLSPRFKKVVAVFGILALIVIIFSLYLVIKLMGSGPSTSSYSIPSYNIPSATNTSTSDINF